MTDTKRYETNQAEWEKWFESLCKRCGKCCRAGGEEPCKNLLELSDGTYWCKVYPDRLGQQETITGKKFNCVPIREARKLGYIQPDCAYKKGSFSPLGEGSLPAGRPASRRAGRGDEKIIG